MPESINGYILETPLKAQNSGYSRWGFAKYGGKKYFIKEFLSPVWPVDESLLGPELTEKKRAVCREYVLQKQCLFEAINQASDGNLMRIEHFFRYGSKYYITMKKVEALPSKDILALPERDKIRLCMILTHALAGLHGAGLVHGDVKLDNVLFFRTPAGGIGARIIDLDNCFWESKPPREEGDIAGDQVYMAPETVRLLNEEDVFLTQKIDVYALGLLFHQIFTGSLPGFDAEKYRYPYQILLENGSLAIDGRIHGEGLVHLLEAMLRPLPEERPPLKTILSLLETEYFKEEDSKTGEKRTEETKRRRRRFSRNDENPFMPPGEDDL